MEVTEISLGYFLQVFARNLKIIVLACIICCGLALLYCWYAPKTYLATVALFPEESGAQPGGTALAMLSSSFGLPVGKSSQFSDLYQDVIKSRTFIREILPRPLQAKDSMTTPQSFYHLKDKSEAEQAAALAHILAKDLDLVKLPNGMMSLTLETTDPVFSASLLNAIITDLERFFANKQKREMERSLEFIKSKIDEKEKIYRASSERVAQFISKNQYLDYQKTPYLYNQLEELKRDQRVQEEIYLLLVKEYEQSQIEKQKEKNLIQVLDYAEPALKKEKPYRVKIMLGAFMGSILLSYGALLVRERLKATV